MIIILSDIFLNIIKSKLLHNSYFFFTFILIYKLHIVHNDPEPRGDATKNIAIQSLTCNIQTK